MKIYPVVLFLLFALPLWGQRTLVEGMVADSAGSALPAATVVLMTPDSIMSGYGLTDDAGKFALRIKGPGAFLLQITYLGYETHWQTITLEAGQEKIALGNIKMSVSSAVLPFVEISAEHDPMRLNRDTVEYNAAAFKVQPGAVVEDLLKKLPGVEVQRDGTVKAHGETVQNVLVDGKEFFGKDTRVATKNLPAEAVDRVQVFDKQSDMAEFTGIDDGQEERTINLKLKEGHKHGYFGKADAGAGTEGRYEGRFNVNRFSPDNRLSAIGMANNTNEVGFSMNDYIQMMGGMGAMMSGGGISLGGGDDGGIPLADQRAGSGIRTSLAGGLNFSKDFSKNTELTGSYFLNRFENDLQQSRFRENLAEQGTFTGEETDDQWSRNYGHNLNLHFRHKIDSFQNIIFRANGSVNDAIMDNLGASAAFEYEFKTMGRLDINYATRFVEPSAEQLQPVVDNSDPLNIFIGNPGLQPEYVHELRAGYFLYDQFTFTSFFANISGSYIKDRITNATTIDSLLRRTVTPINVSHETALRGNISFSTPIRSLGIKTRIQLNSRLTQRILFVNNTQNDVLDWRSGFDFALENRNKDVVDAVVGIRLNNTLTDWSASTSLNQQFINHQWYTQLQYSPTGK